MSARPARISGEQQLDIVDGPVDPALIDGLRRKIEASLANPEPRSSGAEVQAELAAHHAKRTAAQRG